MPNMQNYSMPPASSGGMNGRQMMNGTANEWFGEVNTSGMNAAQDRNMPQTLQNERYRSPAGDSNSMGGLGSQAMQNGGTLDMTNNLPAEVVEAPVSRDEAFFGSLKAMLIQNKGNFIVATFLVGTQNTISWEGILYEVGNDYMTIYQEGRDRYIVCDIYSLKYMEFYDTRRREMCEAMLRESGWRGNS